MTRESSHDNPDYDSIIKEEDEDDEDDDDDDDDDDYDDDEEEKYADAMSIHEDEDIKVVKRSTLKREELRAGKYNRSNRNSPNLLDRLVEDRRSYSQSGKA